jgi:hypothetical protein
MNDTADVADALRAVRDELARLSERVGALEAAAFRAQSGARAAGDGAPASQGANDALLAVLSAAVAAYLGKKPRIRSVRVLSSPEWGRQGRLLIQASHALER